ncbi:hypothetical protein pEaSNUABM13_00031 [Erwinia phage pEa_SNUABM_13]|nr:hypothetical protein pEaSNUABM13_00031 [Erwinia phage pEa_SNUABM_13]
MVKQYCADKYEGDLEGHPVVLLLSFKIGGPTPMRISGRDLYRYLGISKNYSSWVNDSIADCGLVENSDYVIEWFKSDANGHSIEHKFTQHAAIEIAMRGRSTLAKRIRRSVCRRDGFIRFVGEHNEQD